MEGETRTLLIVVADDGSGVDFDGTGSDVDVTTAFIVGGATPFGVVITIGVAANEAEAPELSFPKTRDGRETGFSCCCCCCCCSSCCWSC